MAQQNILDMMQKMEALPEGQIYSNPVHEAIQKLANMQTMGDMFTYVQSNEVRNGNGFSHLYRNIHDVPAQEGRQYNEFIQRLGRIRALPVRTINYI